MKHTGSPILTSERLVLRPFVIDDYASMFANYASDPDNVTFLTWAAHTHEDITKQIVSQWIENYQYPSTYKWAITLKEDPSQVIGDISIVNLREYIQSGELGYVLSKKYWRQGFMTEALTTVIEYLFKTGHFNRLEATHADSNPHSGQVMRKAGMKYIGCRRQFGLCNQGIVDSHLYEILAEDLLS